MAIYVFQFINHLGEPFEVREVDLADEQQALAHAEALKARNYPVEVRRAGVLIKAIPAAGWRLEDWLTPYLGPWPLS